MFYYLCRIQNGTTCTAIGAYGEDKDAAYIERQRLSNKQSEFGFDYEYEVRESDVEYKNGNWDDVRKSLKL